MNREEYLQSLIDKGYSDDQITDAILAFDQKGESTPKDLDTKIPSEEFLGPITETTISKAKDPITTTTPSRANILTAIDKDDIYTQETELGELSKGKNANDPSLKQPQIALAQKMFSYNNSPQCADGDCFSYDDLGMHGASEIERLQEGGTVAKNKGWGDLHYDTPLFGKVKKSDETEEQRRFNEQDFDHKSQIGDLLTLPEKTFGSTAVTDFFGDLSRSWDTGKSQGYSLNSALEIFKDNTTDEEMMEFLVQARKMDEAPQTDEMIKFGQDHDRKIKEMGGVKAFFSSWWDNPSAMTQFSAQSMGNMFASATSSEEAMAAAILAGGVTAKAAGVIGAKAGSLGSPIGTVIGATVGTGTGFVAGAMGALSATMEIGFTTADLLKEMANERLEERGGKQWANMTDEERFGITKEILSDPAAKKDITNRALARGLTIGIIDGFTGLVTGGTGGAVRKVVAKTGRTALAATAQVAAAATTETIGGLASEIGGQYAAGQEFDSREILTEGFADKSFTVIEAGKAMDVNNKVGGKLLETVNKLTEFPKYKINGETLSTAKFRETIQGMDDAAIMGTKIDIDNDPVMSKIVQERIDRINIDQKIDPKISDVNDRSKIIKLERDLQILKDNDTKSGANKRTKINNEISEITDRYEGSKVDVTTQERQQAVAEAFRAKIETEFNDNVVKVTKAAKDVEGVNINTFETTAEVESYLKGLKDKNIDIKKSAGQQGFVIQDPNTGKQEIVLNKEQALKDKAVTVASHEFLHAVLFETVKNNPQNAINLGNSLLKRLNDINIDKIQDSNFKQRMLEYSDQSKDVRMEEALTLFSDAIATGDIKYNESVFTKMGDALRRTLQRFGVNVNFNTGKDVYNFVKDYNANIQKGKLSTAQQKIAAEGAKGTLIKDQATDAKSQTVKESKATPLETINSLIPDNITSKEQLQTDPKAFNDIFTATEKGGVIYNYVNKNSTSKAQFDLNIQNIQDRLVNFDPTAKRKDGSTVGTKGFGEFIFANARFGKMDANKFLAQEQKNLSLDAPEARQVADPTALKEMTPDTGTKPKTDTRKPKINVLKFDGINETDLVEAVKVNKGDTFKQIIDKYTGIIGNKIFNIPADKITEGSKNITYAEEIKDGIIQPSEGGNIQNWFRKGQNTEKFIKILPNESVTSENADVNELGENIDVSKDVKGLAIGLKGRVQNYFYNKTNKRSKGKTSQPYIWTLKSEFKNPTPDIVEKVKRDFGITPTGEKNILPGKAERTTIGQLLKGAAKIYSQQAALSAAQRNLEVKTKEAAKKGKDTKDIKKQTASITAAQKNRFVYSLKKPKNKVGPEGEKVASNIDKEFITEGEKTSEGRDKGINKVLKHRDQKPVHKLNTKNGIDNFIKGIKKDMAPFIPKEFLFRTKAIMRNSDRIAGKEFDAYYQEQLSELQKDPTVAWGEPFSKTKMVNDKPVEIIDNLQQASYDTMISTLERIKKNKGAKIDAWNEKNMAIHEVMWDRVNQSITDNKEAAQAWGNYFSFVSENKNHPHRLGAEFVAYSTNPQGKLTVNEKTGKTTFKLFEMEHAMPATGAYLYLFDSILSGRNFKQDYNAVVDNYKLIALDAADNQKLIDGGVALNMGEGWKVYSNSWLERYFGEQIAKTGMVDPNSVQFLDGKTVSEALNIDYDGNFTNQPIEKSKQKAFRVNNSRLPNILKYSKKVNNSRLLNDLNNYDKAIDNAKDSKAPKKGISVFDFDDTLAKTKSKIIVTTTDGKTKKITPDQFARLHESLKKEGAKFDFSEFTKVIDGKPGPMAAKLKKAISKFGNKDVFVLTARPQESAKAIYEFLKGIGLEVPIKNITGLENGTPKAKAQWIVNKAAKGYNDFYFTDDVYKNVKAVQSALEVLDVKSKTRVAYADKTKKLDADFNDLIEGKTGIGSAKVYSDAKAAAVGASKGKFSFNIPPGAQDFVGLLYSTLAKGKLGDNQMAWYKKNLLDPFARANANLSRTRVALMNDYKALKKQLGIVPKNLNKMITGESFTNEHAVRVYIWNKQGMEIPGLSKADLKTLLDHINNNPDFKTFGDQLIAINKQDGYAQPKVGWLAGTTTTDLTGNLNTLKRARYLTEWQQNADVIFSEKNLNKLEAAFGKSYRTALEGMLKRMKSGQNRNFSGDSLTGKVTDWLTNSIGVVMFFNTKSAILQTISAVNFINFKDNNIFKAGKAFGNQPQFWSDFAKLINSDFLVDRRRGLTMNVNEADIANMARESGPRGVISKLLEFGFLPTQVADSFAIASGGATFYRNRINTYLKQGMDQKAAEKQAFLDFREIAEEAQQSSRPDRISAQQAGPLGRIILAFANTPMQYARLIQKAISDIKNSRGDLKTNVSKVIYYGAVQNLIFNALQQAVFAIAFGNLDEDEEDAKYVNIANGMADSLLRGTGIYGAAASVGKNALMRIYREFSKDRPDYEKVSAELLKISPPVSAKISRINQAARTIKWDKKEIMQKGMSLDNPAWGAAANVVSAATNLPVDRLVKKTNNIVKSTSEDLETWERLALLGGWQDWELGIGKKKKKALDPTKFKGMKNVRSLKSSGKFKNVRTPQ